jgi:carboxymethylenebutenolidase
VADIKATVLYLKEKLGLKKVGILGFCLGGALTVASLANIPELDAGSPYYGVPDLSNFDLSKIKVPVYAYFGENDDHKGFSSPEDGKRLEKAAKDAGVNFTLDIVPVAGHAFMNKNSERYHEPSYTRIIKENTKWFLEIFSK